MFRTALSWNTVQGEVCLLPVVNATKIGPNRYQMNIEVTERGGTAGTIDKILIHVFKDDFSSEDVVYESGIAGQTIVGNETIELSEILEVEQDCWIGYEFIVGEKSFLGSYKCIGDGKMITDEEDQEDEMIEVTEEQIENEVEPDQTQTAEENTDVEEVPEEPVGETAMDEPEEQDNPEVQVEAEEKAEEETDADDQENTEAGV